MLHATAFVKPVAHRSSINLAGLALMALLLIGCVAQPATPIAAVEPPTAAPVTVAQPTATATATSQPTDTPTTEPTATPQPTDTATPTARVTATVTAQPRRITALQDFALYAGPGEEYGPGLPGYDPKYVASMINIKAGADIDQGKLIARHPDPAGRGDWIWVDFTNSNTAGITSVFWVKGWEFDLSAIDMERVALKRGVPTPESAFAVTTGVINLRGGPGTSYGVLGQLQKDQSVPVIGKTQDGSWLQIEHNGRTAWVSASLVRASGVGEVAVVSAPPAPTTAPSAPTSTPEPTATQETVSDRRYIIPAQPNSGFPTAIDLRDQSITRTYNGQWGNTFSIDSRYDAPNGGFFVAFHYQWHMSEVVGISDNRITIKFLSDGRTASYDLATNSHLHIMDSSGRVRFGNIDGAEIPLSIRPSDIVRVGDNIAVPSTKLADPVVNAVLLVRNQ